MRTTIRLPDDLLRQAKRGAAERGVTLTRFFEDAIRETLSRSRGRNQKRREIKLATVNERGLLPGVDLDDTAALLELMESTPRQA